MKILFRSLATGAVVTLLSLGMFFVGNVSAEQGENWQAMEDARQEICVGRPKDVCRQNIECEWNDDKCVAKQECMTTDGGSQTRSQVGCLTQGNRCQWYVPDFLSRNEIGGEDGINLITGQLQKLLGGVGEADEYQIPGGWLNNTDANKRGGMCLSKPVAGLRACVDAAWYELMWAPINIDSAQTLQPGDDGYEYWHDFKQSVEKCFSAMTSEFQLDVYTGPTFDGPGLFGGAELARRQLDNSISKETDLKRLVVQWTRFVLPIAAVIAVIALIWAGILWITDFGDGSRAEQGKKILIWTIAGILLILASYAIVSTVMRASWQDPRVDVTGEKTRCPEDCFWDGYDCRATIRGSKTDEECTIL